MTQHQKTKTYARKPPWLKKRLATGPVYEKVRSLVEKTNLHTVCQEAQCPNIWECFCNQTATFLIMGSKCTRNCRFCAIGHKPTGPPDPDEPIRVAAAAQTMQLRYVVITSVTRDDLPDGGAVFFARTIKEIRGKMPDTRIEVLIPDFQGNADSLSTVVTARPDVLNHNIETVQRLYPSVRPEAFYRRSLELLRQAKAFDPTVITKSGLMLGLGEAPEEIRETFQDILDTGCNILTLGQYLQPTTEHLPVERFVPPEEFDKWRETALEMGFAQVASGPFVRSSYHAKDLYEAVKNRQI